MGAPAPARERADAARNRVKVLDAARTVFARRGFEASTMDDIAAEAGVGKGTLYRRFADKAGLAAALLDGAGAELQQRILSGSPPLGPGAPAAERLVAFVQAYLSFQVDNLDLVLLADTAADGGRLRGAAYAFWRQHCLLLLADVGARDAPVRAEVLMAGLAAQQVQHWTRVRGLPLAELETALGRVAVDLARG